MWNQTKWAAHFFFLHYLLLTCCLTLHAIPCSFVHALMTIRAALDRASVLLSMKTKIMRLDNVWGVGGGQRPVKHLIKEVRRSLHQHCCTKCLCIQDFIIHLNDDWVFGACKVLNARLPVQKRVATVISDLHVTLCLFPRWTCCWRSTWCQVSSPRRSTVCEI